MTVSEAVVSRLKAELKRTLSKHVGDAVNDVCDAFVDELRPVEPPLTPTPHVGALGKEVDYECCWRLVEYMERNMDTFPSFAQQMDCIILAYQSNASSEILNSVVTQNLWVRRKGVKNESLEKKTVELPVKNSEESSKHLGV
ncbi:hypothetical protein V7S43_015022 [Phytophthora oleae]|uniref:HAT C-terminal dimerisation domain-containing protein n=1 Tax=Phytophthora oleae TaxID=2107226 RepID=A0ABD3F379_9STRA